MLMIFRLLSRSRPTTVAWLVMAIVVYAFNGLTKRLFPHIFKEIREGQPPLTDCNAAASIPHPTIIFRIEATRFHRRPRAISLRNNLGCVAVPMIIALSLQTTTALYFPTYDVSGFGCNCLAAIATKIPYSLLVATNTRNRESGKSAEFAAGYVLARHT